MRIARLALIAAAMMPAHLNAAFANGTDHKAMLATPALQERIIAHGMLWRCAAEQCVAPASNSRPLIACQALAREAGPLTRFATGAKTLSPEQLARCNRGTAQERTAAAP